MWSDLQETAYLVNLLKKPEMEYFIFCAVCSRTEDHNIVDKLVESDSVYSDQSNTYDRAFLWKQILAFRYKLIYQNSSIIDVLQDSKYRTSCSEVFLVKKLWKYAENL